MKNIIIFFVFVFISSSANAQYRNISGCSKTCKPRENISYNNVSYPDGTLALSNSRGLVGRIARNITGQHYTHVGVVIDNYVYEQDWPRAKKTHVSKYGKRLWTTDYYIPTQPYTTQQVNAMRATAVSRLGEPYRLKGFWDKSSAGTTGQWCSPYAAHVLNASGRYSLNSHDAHTPGNLHSAVGGGYIITNRVIK